MRETQISAAQRSLAPWRGRHGGSDVVVCGCGPSAFAPPDGLLTIGVNDIGRLFDPTYLVVLKPPRQYSGGENGDRPRYSADPLMKSVRRNSGFNSRSNR